MVFYWSKEKCGDRVVVVTEGDLHDIVQKVCTDWFFNGQGTFGDNFDEVIKFLKDKGAATLWVMLSHRMLDLIRGQPLSTPFTHVKEEELEKVFLRKVDKLRGREKMITRCERDFWSKFPELSYDDPEDEFNEIVGILRRTAENYFKKVEEEQSVK